MTSQRFLYEWNLQFSLWVWPMIVSHITFFRWPNYGFRDYPSPSFEYAPQRLQMLPSSLSLQPYGPSTVEAQGFHQISFLRGILEIFSKHKTFTRFLTSKVLNTKSFSLLAIVSILFLRLEIGHLNGLNLDYFGIRINLIWLRGDLLEHNDKINLLENIEIY